MHRRRFAGLLAILMAGVLVSGCPVPRNKVRLKVVNNTSNFYGSQLLLSRGTPDSMPIQFVSDNLLTNGDVDPGQSAQADVLMTTIDELNANSITLFVLNAPGTLQYTSTISAGGFEGGTQYTLTMENLGPNDHKVTLTKQ